jgi:hypothetical protein
MAGHVWELVLPLIVVLAGIAIWTARRFVGRFVAGLRGE